MRGVIILSALLVSACATPTSRYAPLADPGGCRLERIAVEPDRLQFAFNGASPDGRTVAVGWEQGSERGAYLLDLKSGDAVDQSDRFNNAVSYSPDGRRLISAVYTPGLRTEIVELDLEADGIRTLASDPAAEFLPSYSPDMRRIYFNSTRTGRSDIYALDLATAALTRLTDFTGYDAYAQPSPDGRKLAFHRDVGGGNYEIVVLDLVSGRETVLASAPGEDSYPAWSPNGRHVLFSSDRAQAKGRNDLYLMTADGADIRRLTHAGGNDSYAQWTRGGRVYFVSHREGHGVYRLALDRSLACRKAGGGLGGPTG
jgi:Tol biopolymer transport system component